MAPRAGYATVLEVGGTSTAFTGEATTNTTGNTYQITNSAKRVLDPAAAVTVKDGGAPVAPASIDRGPVRGETPATSHLPHDHARCGSDRGNSLPCHADRTS